MLYFLYPLSIVLILLALFGGRFDHDASVYRWTIGFTMIAAVLDLLRVSRVSAFEGIIALANRLLPLNALGLGWILPAALGLAIGLILRQTRSKREKQV